MKGAYVFIPEQVVILLTGIPGAGKTTFAKNLARVHGFAHYDLEHYPCGWPHKELDLKRTWDCNRADFLATIRQNNRRIVLDWGFPASHFPWVQELQDHGARLIWFDGDVDRARKNYVERELRIYSAAPERELIEHFNQKWEAIQQAGYPGSLGCQVVQTLAATGTALDESQIESIVFP